MKKVITLSVAFCLFLVFQANAQQDLQTTNKGPKTAILQNEILSQAGNPVGQPSVAFRKYNPDQPQAIATRADGFPVFVNTGNPVKDSEMYEQAKEEWIRNNPEKYQEMQKPGYSPQK